MTPNSLSPASIKIDYHTAYGSHAMTIPTLAWNPVGISGGLGSYTAWDSSTRDGEAMVTNLVNKLKKFMLPTTTFDQATAYTQATPTSPNIPRATIALGIAGVSSETSGSQAVSCTFNFKTSINGNARLVLLDSPVGGLWFAPTLPADFSGDVLSLETEFCGNANAWAGRDDAQPTTLRKITRDLNDKLQKLYWG